MRYPPWATTLRGSWPWGLLFDNAVKTNRDIGYVNWYYHGVQSGILMRMRRLFHVDSLLFRHLCAHTPALVRALD